jgi:hypothetical protein
MVVDESRYGLQANESMRVGRGTEIGHGED